MNTGRCVSWVLSAVCFQVHLLLLARCSVPCFLSVSSVCATTCELDVHEHSKAQVNSSSVELRGAAGTCGQLRTAPRGFSPKGRGRMSISFP